MVLPFQVLETEDRDTESGLGDLYLQAGHLLIPETDGGLSVYGSGALKVPTADEDAGRGTGEPDLGGYLTPRQDLGSWQLSGYGGYTIRGEPAGFDYNSITSYGVKATRSLNGTVVFGGLDGSTALTDNGDPPLEVFAGSFWLLPESRVFTADIAFGLSDGSPDLSLGVGVVQWF
ncbi:transporter [Thiohalorhabdus sp.]|uniref:transporter n=1 Tax=Thiohalorhabdus sp. TaxID=3094134 RepID=UPI002FC37E8F